MNNEYKTAIQMIERRGANENAVKQIWGFFEKQNTLPTFKKLLSILQSDLNNKNRLIATSLLI